MDSISAERGCLEQCLEPCSADFKWLFLFITPPANCSPCLDVYIPMTCPSSEISYVSQEANMCLLAQSTNWRGGQIAWTGPTLNCNVKKRNWKKAENHTFVPTRESAVTIMLLSTGSISPLKSSTSLKLNTTLSLGNLLRDSTGWERCGHNIIDPGMLNLVLFTANFNLQ